MREAAFYYLLQQRLDLQKTGACEVRPSGERNQCRKDSRIDRRAETGCGCCNCVRGSSFRLGTDQNSTDRRRTAEKGNQHSCQ